MYARMGRSMAHATGAAITAADRPPAEVVRFRKMVKIMCEAGDLRVLGKITIVDKKGRHW